MKLHVELEDGKSDDVFIPANCLREGQELGLDGVSLTLFCGWWAFHRRGLTDCEDWEAFGDVAFVSGAEEDADPKAPPT